MAVKTRQQQSPRDARASVSGDGDETKAYDVAIRSLEWIGDADRYIKYNFSRINIFQA